MNIYEIHELPNSHPISKRDGISLAHINTAACLRKNTTNFKKLKAKGVANNKAAVAELFVGQNVKTRLGAIGTITAINGGHVTIDLAGSEKIFPASTLSGE